MSATLFRVVPSDEHLRGEDLVWLTGVVVCLLAAAVGPMSVSAGSGQAAQRRSQSTATSEIVKYAVLVLPCK